MDKKKERRDTGYLSKLSEDRETITPNIHGVRYIFRHDSEDLRPALFRFR